MEPLDWASFQPGELPAVIVGRDVQFVPSVGSTNDALKDAARAGSAEGVVVVADEQVAGRGRRGRSWSAPAGTSLLVSILLRPMWLPAGDSFLLTILAAVAVAEALERSGVAIDVKWPNDLEINGRKLGGILVETEISDSRIQWAIIGCGININWNPRTIPELTTRATSLSMELGHTIPRRPLLQALLTVLDRRYVELRLGARSALFAAWRDRLYTLGQAVRAQTPQGTILGRAVDVTPDGALVIRDDHGRQHVVTAGDVSVRASEPSTKN